MNQFKSLSFALCLFFMILLALPQPVEADAVFKSPTDTTICQNQSFRIKWKFSPSLDQGIEKLKLVLCRNGSVVSVLKKFFSTECCFRDNSCCYFNWTFKGTSHVGSGFSFRIIGVRKDKSKVKLGESHRFTVSRCDSQSLKIVNPNKNQFNKSVSTVTSSPPKMKTVFLVTNVRLEAIPRELVVGDNAGERKKAFAEAFITVIGKGTVVYKWVHYNGSTNGEKMLVFDKSGTQRIETSWDWWCNHPHLTYNWKDFKFTLKISAPNQISKTVTYRARCQKSN